MRNKKKSKKNKGVVKWGLVLLGVLFVGLVVLFYTFVKAMDDSSPNVVIVLIDTLRADHCSVYGYERDTTPHMKRIAEKGLILENHFVNAPWTKPSTASIISGLYPTAHGCRLGQFENLENQVSPVIEILQPEIDTMAEILKRNGYETLAFITNYHLTPQFGYAQGYDYYHFDPYGSDKKIVCQKDKEMMDAVEEILENRNGKPCFIWCHLMTVHEYAFPPDCNLFRARSHTPVPSDAKQAELIKDYHTIEEAAAHYDNSILYTDRLVGKLFDFISQHAPNTIFIVTSDHGEEFYEHGGFEHARTLYNEILKVPCIIWGPGVPQGEVFHGLSDSIDLMPTILKNLGIGLSKGLRGQAIFLDHQIIGETEKEIFAEQHHRGLYKRYAMIWKGRKIILNEHKWSDSKTYEVYDDALAIEKTDMAEGVDPKLLKRFKRKIYHYKSFLWRYFKNTVGELKYKSLTKGDIHHLRSLGYIK